MRSVVVMLLLLGGILLGIPAISHAEEENEDRITQLLMDAFLMEDSAATAEDTTKLVQIYRELADLGNSFGMCMMGRAYDLGWSVARDTVEAYNWYAKSAALKDQDGLRWTGECQIQGWGTPINIDSGLAKLEEAIDSGNTEAACYLGGLYFYNETPLYQDDYLAEMYFTMAAQAGNLESQRALVALYSEQDGELFNDSLGMKWTEKVLEQVREPLYLSILGDYYRHGYAADQNYVTAGNLYYEAAQTNFAYAEEELGWLCFSGLGTNADLYQSYSWANRSINHITNATDSTIALANVTELLDSLAAHLTPEQMDSAKTITPGWYPVEAPGNTRPKKGGN